MLHRLQGYQLPFRVLLEPHTRCLFSTGALYGCCNQNETVHVIHLLLCSLFHLFLCYYVLSPTSFCFSPVFICGLSVDGLYFHAFQKSPHKYFTDLAPKFMDKDMRSMTPFIRFQCTFRSYNYSSKLADSLHVNFSFLFAFTVPSLGFFQPPPLWRPTCPLPVGPRSDQPRLAAGGNTANASAKQPSEP